MTHRFTLYTNPMSRGRMARWMLEECGAQYDTVILQYGAEMKSPDYLRINPMGKVPALVHHSAQGDVVITEVAAILTYLADIFPEKKLVPPAGSAARGTYYRWLFFVGSLESAITAKTMNLLPPADKAMSVGYGDLDTVLHTTELACQQALAQGGALCGAEYSAADFLLAGYLNFWMSWGALEKREAFVQYVQPIVERSAFVRAVAQDDALMPKKEQS